MHRETLADALRHAISRPQTLQLGAIPILNPLLEELGLRDIVNAVCPTEADVDLGLIAQVLVLNRLLSPQPLCRVSRWLGSTILGSFLGLAPDKLYDQRLGRALDALHPHLGEIWSQLVVRAMQVWKLDLSVLHWDITSFYFTGAYTDSELVRYGYSRDHRPHTKQVNLQADVTHRSRVPVGYQVLPGQTADITTPQGHLQALLRFLRRPELTALNLRPILVSDCKMITPQAVAACHDNGLFYLGPWAQNGAITDVLKSVSEVELAAHPLGYRPCRQAQDADFVPYCGVWRSFEVTVPPPKGTQNPAAVFTDRVLVVWSAGKARLDAEKRRTYLKRLLDGLQSIARQLNRGRYAKRDYVVQRIGHLRRGNPAQRLVQVDLQGSDKELRLKFRLDRERLAAARAVDGRYALGTNAEHLSADEALRLFKAQDDAEKQFRAVKGPLAVRPVFLHSDRRIEGVVFITMVALLVRALLTLRCREAGLKVSADRLLAEFAPWSAIDLTLADGTHLREIAAPTELQAQVMAALGVEACESYLTA